MLGVLFVLLKVLAIMIVSIIGILLIVLFLVLFMPVKYSLEGSKTPENLFFKAYITYLNPIFKAKILISDPKLIDIRVFGFPIRKKKIKIDKIDTVEKQDSSNSKRGSMKFKKVLSKTSEYLKVTNDYKHPLIEVLKIVLKAIISILPKECNAEVKFGTGQADTTGYVYAVYYAVEELLPKSFEIYFEPVWLDKQLEGKFFLRGKIRLIFLLVAIIKIVCNKDVRRFYKLIRSV